jgi:endonuclease YncB( thermonuclease family)
MSFPAAGKPVITGMASVIDNDTIDVNGTRIHLLEQHSDYALLPSSPLGFARC